MRHFSSSREHVVSRRAWMDEMLLLHESTVGASTLFCAAYMHRVNCNDCQEIYRLRLLNKLLQSWKLRALIFDSATVHVSVFFCYCPCSHSTMFLAAALCSCVPSNHCWLCLSLLHFESCRCVTGEQWEIEPTHWTLEHRSNTRREKSILVQIYIRAIAFFSRFFILHLRVVAVAVLFEPQTFEKQICLTTNDLRGVL